ncbi:MULTISPECIES: GNAT family N-acetyltransferase [Lichenihabitans]|uniref:GNAT family N-acetyltransferase n=1 Tax=Lichenihabitans TaxID=2723776 RepID=UPI001035A112|nr:MULTISPECIES: GNAT family protein [Lichenihabitans]UDL96112.1 GNAT family N-acetyltransferase [Lichenihabitans sp. PAMC28606]
MALFRIGSPNEASTFLRGDRVFLRPAEMRDYEQWSTLRDRSRTFLTPWEPIWPADDLTRASFRRRIRAHAEEIEADDAYPFLIFREDETLIGGLTIGQVTRGVSQTATLGYWMGQPYAGHGYMSRAVRAAAHFTFGTLRLHRFEAACLAHNNASIRVLERVGFQREGFARSYLRINGRWQDHILFALLESDPIAGPNHRPE